MTRASEAQTLVLENQDVVIESGVIRQIGHTGTLTLPAEHTQISGAGKYLVPGLAEMHGHVPPLANFQDFPERYVNDVLFLYLAGGVTTVRGMLGYPHQLQLANEIVAGERWGPTLYLAGPSFSGGSVDGVSDVRRRVRTQAEEGWKLLKVHPGLSLREYQALSETARVEKISFGGHVPEAVGVRHAIILGSSTIDHLDGYMTALYGFTQPINEAEARALAQFSRAHGVAMVPTQALWETIIGAGDVRELETYEELQYMPKALRERWKAYAENPNSGYATVETAALHAENRRRLLEIFHQEGVEILLGTDAPQLYSVPGFSVHREFPHMLAAGMSPYEVLVSGTRAVSEHLLVEAGIEDRFGVVEVGARADLLLLSENPVESLDALKAMEGVFVQGRWLSKSMIDEKLSEIAAAYQ